MQLTIVQQTNGSVKFNITNYYIKFNKTTVLLLSEIIRNCDNTHKDRNNSISYFCWNLICDVSLYSIKTTNKAYTPSWYILGTFETLKNVHHLGSFCLILNF